MKSLSDSAFTIIGTGLMGSSLALALRDQVKALHGVDSHPAARQAASGYFDSITGDLDSAVQKADVVILATPVQTILRLLDKIKAVARPGTLIFDLGSAKVPIVEAMDTLPEYLIAVGGHPMCGKEQSGPEAADGAIFDGSLFILCPTQRSTSEALDFGHDMIRAIGGRHMMMTAAIHDQAVASISHLPYLLSVGLVKAVQCEAEDDGVAWKLASSGFRDTSRLAASDVTMMGDTVLTNREAVIAALRLYQAQLADIQSALESNDEQALRGILDSARQARITWAKSREPKERHSHDHA